MQAVVFASGIFNPLPPLALRRIHESKLIIAANGGTRHCLALGLMPHLVVGDLDSLADEDREALVQANVEIHPHPRRKDYTDLELALRLAKERGASGVLVLAGLGARWDQTLANLLLPAEPDLSDANIVIVDGPQEIRIARSGARWVVHGLPGDLVSLIPLAGDAHGITTRGLEYPLDHESLRFGATRGISNVLLGTEARIQFEDGLLACVVIHQEVGEAG